MLAPLSAEELEHCSALTARGERCRNRTLEGGDRCAFHKGAAADAQALARRRRRDWWEVAGILALFIGCFVGVVLARGLLQNVFGSILFALLGISLVLETNWGRGRGDSRDPWSEGYDAGP